MDNHEECNNVQQCPDCNCRLEIIVGLEKIKPDKFLEFENDDKYFAVIGADVYQKIKDNNYQLIKKDIFELRKNN